MSRPCLTGSITAVCVLAMSASLAFAQSQWKEIPVGYNMPAMAMAATPAGAMPAPFPKAASKSSYRGQGRDPKPSWEVEIHGGGFFGTSQDDGTPGAFAPGTPFLTQTSGDPSLAVSSYMFGPGALLTQQFGATLPTPFAGVTGLDPVALSQIGKRDNGAAIGFRISRDLTSRFNLEFSGDYSSSAVSISDKTLLAAQTTASSFLTFFQGANPNTLIAQIDKRRSAGAQIFWTGVVNVNLKTSGKNIPYLTFGGGGVSNVGPAPHVAILGYYDFDGASGPHAETDVVNLRSVGSRTEWLGVLGVGYKYYATSHWGIRFDLRDHITPYRLDTKLDATPHVATLAPVDVIEGLGGSNPDLQFSNDPATAPSSLSGPAIVGQRTFKGSGWFNQVNASGGIFYRF